MRLGCVNGACLLLAAAAAVGAAEPPIRVPSAPVVPQPMPAPPGPDASLRLAGDALYVIDSDLPVIVLASPKGLVSVTQEAGPLRIRGKFVDGLGKVESRTFKGKHVITVEPLATGRVELLIVPQGATKESDVIRRTLDVDAGDGPRPPPVPPDPKPVPPDPKPKPPTGEVAWLVVVEETAQRTPATAKVLGDLAYWQGLKARGVEWRHYDKDAPEAKSRNYSQFADESGLPSLLLLTKTGERLKVVRLPATTAGIDSLLKEFGK